MQLAGRQELKAVTAFETAEHMASAVAVQIIQIPQVSPTIGSFIPAKD